jgi:hypothetical protein
VVALLPHVPPFEFVTMAADTAAAMAESRWREEVTTGDAAAATHAAETAEADWAGGIVAEKNRG